MANGTLKVSNIQTSSGSGTITLGQSRETVNIPSGTTVSGAGANTPAFSLTNSVAQSIPHATFTKLTFDTEDYDTDNCVTSDRFTPTTAGKYVFTVNLCYSNLNNTDHRILVSLYKNGGFILAMGDLAANTDSGADPSMCLTQTFEANGTSDYFEAYAYQDTGSSHDTFAGRNKFMAHRLIGV